MVTTESNYGMDMNEEVRRENLRVLSQKIGSDGKPADAVGRPRPNISQVLSGKRPFGEKLARSIEIKMNLPSGWMDQPKEAEESIGGPIALRPSRRVQIVGEVRGGPDGYLEETQYNVGEGYILYPTTDQNAYAVRVRGDSMHPRYRAGEYVIVEPSLEAMPQEDVVVCCKNGKKMLKMLNWIKDGEAQFLSINNGYPPMTLLLEEIETIQLVAGSVSRRAMIK